MLTIIINWIYILFTTFCMGFVFSKFSEKVLGYRFKSMNTVLITGMIMATVYAEIFSLFYRVNIEANVVLVVFCMVACVVLRKSMVEFLRESFASTALAAKILIPIVFFAWAYFTSRGYMVPDMDLYHGQSIRWIEEYGVVKGLGNLHNRFGYNSSIFATSALYGMKFVFGRSLHTVNGLTAFLMTLEVLKLGRVIKRKRMLLSDYARVGLFYYLSTVWDEIIAPSSDYAVMFMLFFVVIKWLAQLEAEDEREQNNIAPYALLCVAGAYTLTLKVTAGLILILLIKPAYQLLKEKRWKEIAIYLVMGLLAAVPWLVRNVMITGWLLYPFPALDLFNVEWKMTDLSIINTDAELIKVYARGVRDIGIGVPLQEWVPIWFRTQLLATEKLLILADWAACILLLGLAAWTFVKRKWKNLDTLLVLVTVCSSFLFWQFSAPMMRYGYAHVLLLAALVYGFFLEKINKEILSRVVVGAFALFIAYRVCVGFNWIRGSWQYPAYVWQETYDTYQFEEHEIGGITFYFPVGGRAGYDTFPAGETYREGAFELLGDGLEDGFRCTSNGVE